MRIIDKILHLIQHPYSVFPGSPKYIINDARQYVLNKGISLAGGDYVEGPKACYWELDEPELVGLKKAQYCVFNIYLSI